MTLNYGKRAEEMDKLCGKKLAPPSPRNEFPEPEPESDDGWNDDSWSGLWRWYKRYVREVALPAVIVVVLFSYIATCSGEM